MIISNTDLPTPILWDEKTITYFEEKNKSKKICTIVWHQDEAIISKQIDFAFENNVDVLLSELLPAELPFFISKEKIKFFRDKFIFLPPLISSQEIRKSKDDFTRIIFLNDESSECDFDISLLKIVKLKSNDFYREVKVNYDNINLNDIFDKITNCSNILVNIKNPQLLTLILNHAINEDVKVKYINNHFIFAHRMALFGFFINTKNQSNNHSIRAQFTYFISSNESILSKSVTLKVFDCNEQDSKKYLLNSTKPHISCEGIQPCKTDLVKTSIYKLTETNGIENYPAITQEQRRFFVYFISQNKNNINELNSEFVTKSLEVFLLSTYHYSYYKSIADIISISKNLIPILTKIALQIGQNFPDLPCQGVYGEALLFSQKFNNNLKSSDSVSEISKIYDNNHKSIKGLFHYHKDFLSRKSTERLNLFKSILSDTRRKNVAFESLINLLPFESDFDDWSELFSDENITDDYFNKLVNAFFISNGISVILLSWSDEDYFKGVMDKHLKHLQFIHNVRPYFSNSINQLFIRYDESFDSSLSKSDNYQIFNYLFNLIFNLKMPESKLLESSTIEPGDISFIHLFINHFHRFLPYKTESVINNFTETNDILSYTKGNPGVLGFLKFLFTEYEHPLTDKLNNLNESLNPMHLQMEKYLTNKRFKMIIS
jgi:hypothetical protein